MDRSENRRCEGSSMHNGGWPVYLLLDKRPGSDKINDSQETNKIPIQTSKSTVNLDNALGGKSHVSSNSVSNLLQVKPSETPPESEKDFVRSIVDRILECQTKDIDSTTGIRLKEPAHTSTGHEWESVDCFGALGLRQLCGSQLVVSPVTMEAGPSNENANNLYDITKNIASMHQLSDDDRIQYGEEDLPKLLYLLKNNYPFREVTNKDILRNDEINKFAELYNITNVCPVLSCYNSIFWLKDPDGVIYMWSRIDEMMIRGGGDMKEALINYLFHQENLCYIEEETHELIPIKEAIDEAKKWYERGKKTAIEFVVNDESLKPLKEKKRESKNSGKQKKKQKRKNKH